MSAQVNKPNKTASTGKVPLAIYRAVEKMPITGLPTFDAKILQVTAQLESSGKDVLNHPGSSATGYYGLTKGARSDMRKVVGKPFSRDLYTQSLYAAAYYRYLLDRMNAKPSLIKKYSDNNYVNTYLNIRHRYVSGLGTAQLNHPHALAAVKKAKPYLPYLTQADIVLVGDLRQNTLPDNLKFMSPHLKDEFSRLPQAVRKGTLSICDMIPDGEVHVSSVRSSYTGAQRTAANGPNHYEFRAIDIVPAPKGWGPMYKDQAGGPRSPHFNWNRELHATLISRFKEGLLPCAVACESDHLHLDDTHEPGIYTYSSHRSNYPNDAVSHCSMHKLERID